jgi:hypothetical protein
MKMNETNLRKKLCQTFCKYYKPSKKEEISCEGYRLTERLILKGTRVPFDRCDRDLHRLTQETLVQAMCTFCPFYENDCDFVQHKESPPCGGFLLLGHLLETEVISIDNIKDVR